MSYKKLDTTLFSAWNSYAVSMMSVLEDCGMWNKEDTFQKFLGVTGIAAQIRIDKNCSALPVTDYDWRENVLFMERIGVTTKVCFAALDDTDYTSKQEAAISEVKEAIDNDKAVTVWGIGTGEFGIIDGYDEEDEVFFVKGIGSNNSNSNLPILFKNLGKTFEHAPILYCEIPDGHKAIDWKQSYIDSLQIYLEEMQKISETPDVSYGISAYDRLVSALEQNHVDDFGLRYCIGIYYERKEAMFLYLKEIREVFSNSSIFDRIIETFHKISKLYYNVMFEILKQGTCGWNDLRKPIDKKSYPDIILSIKNIKSNEIDGIELIKRFLEEYKTN